MTTGVSVIPSSDAPAEHPHPKASLAALTFGALGVVFGDIGTSPLYTLRECLRQTGGGKPTPRTCSGSCHFGILQRNAVAADSHFQIPPEQVIEIGIQLDL